MSWIQQQTRRNQGGWVAGMPTIQRQRHVMVGYAKMRTCPLVGLVGACCSGCAEGKGCGAKDDPHVHAAVQARVGETAIPWDDVAQSNATIEHVQEAAGSLAGFPQGSPELQRYALWSLFYTTWQIWYASAKAQVDSDWLTTGLMFGTKLLHGDMADTYKSLILNFNEQLKALDAIGAKASAEPIDTRSPASKSFDETIKGVLGGAGGALGVLSTALTYVAIAGAIGLGLYYGGPLLFGMLRKAKK